MEKNNKYQFISTSKAITYIKIYKAPIIVFSISIFFSIMVIIILMVIKLNNESEYSNWQKDLEKQRQQSKRNYENLISKQKNSTDEIIIKTEDPRKALGHYNIHIVFVKPETFSNKSITPLLAEFKKTDTSQFTTCTTVCMKNISAYFMNSFFDKEATKYGITDFKTEIIFHGPYNITDLNKVGDFANRWGKDFFSMQILKDNFNEVLKTNNVKLSSNDLVEFLYFDNTISYDKNTDKNSFYDFKKFRSFADMDLGRSYINIYETSPFFSSDLTDILTHETLHLFGATDKYNDYSPDKKCIPNGRGNTDLPENIPQSNGDIMCLYVQKGEKNFIKGSLLDNTMVINKITAKEIGWIKN